MTDTRGLNSLQLWEALNKNHVTRDYSDGVFPLDHLHHLHSKPRLVIVNTDPEKDPGKHWLLFFYNPDDSVDFFDSLGKSPFSYPRGIVDFMKKWAHQVQFTTDRVQPLGSALCGHYCLYYAYSKCTGQSMEQILGEMPSPQWIEHCIPLLFDIAPIKSKCQSCISA